MVKSLIKDHIEAIGGVIKENIIENVFEVEYRGQRWWIGQPEEEQEYAVQFEEDGIKGEPVDFCPPTKEDLKKLLDKKIKQSQKIRRNIMQIELIETITIECEEEQKKEMVGRLTEHNIPSENIVKKTTIVKNVETGEEYINTSSV